MSFDPRLPQFVAADRLGFSFPCTYCDETVDGLSEPTTEDGTAHLACVPAHVLDAHVCRTCRGYSESETDPHGRCAGCAEIAAEAEIAAAEIEADAIRVAAERARARNLAVEQLARQIGFTTYRVLRSVITMSRVEQTYRSTHGELQHLRRLASLGLVTNLGARSVGGKAYAYDFAPTADGVAVAGVWEAVAAKVSAQARARFAMKAVA